MVSTKMQKGYSMLPAMLLALGIGSAALVGTMTSSNEEKQALIPQIIAEDIYMIQSAVHSYMDDNNLNDYSGLADPNFLNSLIEDGYLAMDLESPVGTLYTHRVTSSRFEIIVDAEIAQYAAEAKSLVINGVANEDVLTSSMPLPSQSELYDDYVGRYADPDKPERQQFTAGTNIDLGGNDIDSARQVDAENVQSATINAEKFDANALTVDSKVALGSAADISGSGGNLLINASQVQIDGQVNTTGDLIGNNSQASGINQLESQEVNTESLAADAVTTDSANATNAEITNANITALSGEEVTANSASFQSMVTESLDSTSGSITDVSGDTASAEQVELSSTTSQSVQGAAASIQSLQGLGVSSASGQFGDAQIDSLTSNETQVTGTASANQLDVTGETSVTGTITSDNTASIAETVVTGSGTAGAVDGESINAGSLIAMNTTTVDLNIAGVSSLGVAQATNLNVSGELKSRSANFSSADIGQKLTFNSASGGDVLLGGSTLTATVGDFNPGNVSATTAAVTTDAYSSDSSINANYQQINNMQSDLDECMYGSKWCFPQKPRISLWTCGSTSTTACDQAFPREYMTASVIANIVDCRHGCSYTWSVPSVFNGVGCGSGTVAVGGTKSLTCKVTNKSALGPRKTAAGTVSLTVRSLRDTTLTASNSRYVKLFNSQYQDPFAGASYSFIYNPSTAPHHKKFSGTLGGSAYVRMNFTPPSGLPLSDYSVYRSATGVTSASYCTTSVSGDRMTLTHRGGSYEDCKAKGRIRVVYNGAGTYKGAAQEKISAEVIVGSSDSPPTNPFSAGQAYKCINGVSGTNSCTSTKGQLSKAGPNYAIFNYPSSEYTIQSSGVGPGGTGCYWYYNSSDHTAELRVTTASQCFGTLSLDIRHVATGQTRSVDVSLVAKGGSTNYN